MEFLDILRIATGAFFAISGYHKIANAKRHENLVNTLKADHIPFIPFMQWWVPCWEFLAGTWLTFGAFSKFSAFVLLVICTVACITDGKKRVNEFQPIDKADAIDDWLYLPEVLYALILSVIIFH